MSALSPGQSRPQSRRLVLCIDGTWNGTYTRKKREDGHYVIKPSNVLKLARAILPRSPAPENRDQIVYYDIGVGSLSTYPGSFNRALRLVDRTLGGSRGAGFEGNIEDALGFLTLNRQPGDEVFILGFSRGAATAQAIARFIGWAGGLPTKRDAYYLASLFRMYVETRGEIPVEVLVAKINADRALEPIPKSPMDALAPVTVTFLGVWDTVIAIGSRTAPGKPPGRDFHIARTVPECVRHACQALAIDEVRTEFRPEIWDDCDETQTLAQRWFAGVHSNVGGGYVQDGLANLAFQWMRSHAELRGLAVDDGFAAHYRGYAQGRQYRSDSRPYRIWDQLPGRRGRGKRRLLGQPDSGNLTLDSSVLFRIAADPAERDDTGELRYPQLSEPYRPRNVIAFLADQRDLTGYLRSLDATPSLPTEVIDRINKIVSEATP